jgi:putative transposase
VAIALPPQTGNPPRKSDRSSVPVKYDPEKHKRRSIRLRGYDYSTAGMYFITLCTHQRECLFGEISDGVMQLNALGEIVQAHWMRLPKHHSHLQLDAFIVMPNHFHGILVLTHDHPTHGPVGAGLADTIMVSTDSESTKPALPYSDTISDTIMISADPEKTKPAFPYSTDSENSIDSDTTQSIHTNQSQHSGGIRAGSIETFLDESHSILAKPAPTQTLNRKGIPEILRGFKTFSARRINEKRRMQGTPVWQRNYYEHIIRNDPSLQTIQTYIRNNPKSWQTDCLYPDNS